MLLGKCVDVAAAIGEAEWYAMSVRQRPISDTIWVKVFWGSKVIGNISDVMEASKGCYFR